MPCKHPDTATSKAQQQRVRNKYAASDIDHHAQWYAAAVVTAAATCVYLYTYC
jgi:hypothetical protein